MAQLRISAWAIRHPSPVALLFIALVITGAFSYFTLPIKQFPNIAFPAVMVVANLSGAAPAEVESQITRPIENAVASLPRIDVISSTVQSGSSVTMIQFEIGEDLQQVTDDVRSRVEQIRSELPREMEAPTIQRLEFDATPISFYAVSAPSMSMTDLSWFIDDTVARVLQNEKGVGSVNRFGGADREINIIVDPIRMAAQGVTAPQINAALNSVTLDAPGGRVAVGGREQTVRVLGAATSIEDVRAITIPVNGREVRLTDVAEVGDGSNEIRRIGILNGRPVVGFEVIKAKNASDVAVEDRVDAALERIKEQYPGIEVTKVYSIVYETRESYHATLATLLEGMLLASLVVLFFLRDWRATLITALAMPVSLIPTFAIMAMLGFSLNVVTLLSLTLVIGILVDDAIVEIENIEKRVVAGMRPYAAAMEGADQIGLAVVATTLAIVVVFLPVSFMPGIPGQFFKEFGMTVSVAVMFSLVVARLLTPLLAAYFLKPKEGKERKPLPKIYTRVLDWSLDHKWASIAVGLMIFASSIFLAGTGLSTGLTPESNPDFYQVNVEGPPGATIDDTLATAGEVAALLQGRPETEGVFMQVGSALTVNSGGFATTSQGANQSTLTVLLKPDHKPLKELREEIRPSFSRIPDARISFLGLAFGTSGAQVILTSDTGENLEMAALQLQREMRALPEVAEPRTTQPPSSPEIVIKPRWDEAARLGVTAQSIAQVARVATVGDIDANVPKLTEGERRIPIRVRLPEGVRTDLSTIRNLQVPTASGVLTSLQSVADVEFLPGPTQIDRFDRKRQITVQADISAGSEMGSAMAAVKATPIMKNLPPGVEPASAGEQQAQQELFLGFFIAIIAGTGLVYGVMVLLFQSFFKPIPIMFALPLALVGGILGLIVMDMPLDLPSLIGFLMLMGLAAKNSILLVEYAIEREREGHGRREAILEACRERARPIVMTSLAMMAGMLPTALAIGEGSEFRQPMAVAVIGGLITSTVLSLILVPAAYEIVDSFEAWLRPKLSRFVTPREAPQQV